MLSTVYCLLTPDPYLFTTVTSPLKLDDLEKRRPVAVGPAKRAALAAGPAAGGPGGHREVGPHVPLKLDASSSKPTASVMASRTSPECAFIS